MEHQEVKAFANVEAIGNLFISIVTSNQTLAVVSQADPNLVASIRTLMFAYFEVGKLAGRQELMDETISGLENLKGVTWY
jgi:hypothetical protein